MVQRPASSGGRVRLITAIAAVVVALDAASKALAVHYLTGQGQIEVLGGLFHLQLYRNFAGPGNSFQGHGELIALFALAATVVLVVAATRIVTRTSAIAVGLLLGGAVGNLLDRLLRAPAPLHGGVVDWLKPTASGGSMNLADLAINAAIIVMVVGSALTWWRDRAPREQPGAAAPPTA